MEFQLKQLSMEEIRTLLSNSPRVVSQKEGYITDIDFFNGIRSTGTKPNPITSGGTIFNPGNTIPATKTDSVNKVFDLFLKDYRGKIDNPTPKVNFPTNLSDILRETTRGVSEKTANGQIDRAFSQGSTGDCWLLASIQALAMSPKGLKLLNDSVKVLSNGNVQVTLKGVGVTYTFTQAELNSRNKLSTGDMDVRAIEMAVEKYMKKHPMNGRSSLRGNQGWVAFKLLTGKKVSNRARFTDKQIDNFNNPNNIAVVAHNGKQRHKYKNKRGQSEELVGNHEYAVKGSDKNYVYLVNPWNTAKVISVPRADFKKFFNFVNEFNL